MCREPARWSIQQPQGFELADLSLVLSSGDDLVGVLFRVLKSQAADREIGEFIIVPRSHPR